MQRGIVIDIHSKHWVVMTTDGLFIKVPIKDPLVTTGEEVSFSLAQMPKKWNWKRYVTGAVAAMFTLFFLFSSFFENNAHAQTYVYVEIHPGVEISLNERLEVIRVRPLDKEAKALLNQLKWDKESVKNVVVDYLNQAKKQGYLQKKDEIVISAINEKGSSRPTLHSIRKEINQDPKIGKKELDLHVFTFPLPKEIKQKAENTGLTPGKYGVWLLSKKSGREFPVKQMSTTPISELTNDVSLLDDPPNEKEWKEIVEKEVEKDQTPVDTTDKSKTEQDAEKDQPKEQDQKETDSTSNQKEKPPINEKEEDQPSSTEEPAKNETPSKTDDLEKNESTTGSTSGLTEDSDPQIDKTTP